MGGPGYLIRRKTLSEVVPYLNSCVEGIKNSKHVKYIWHSDVVISKCIYKFTSLGCYESDAPDAIAASIDSQILENYKLRDSNYIAFELLQEKGLLLTPAFESHQLVSIGRMVSEGLGLSVVPSTSRAQMEEMGLQCRAISAPVITHQVGIVTRPQHALSAAAQAMEEFIRAAVGKP
jgi:hypothetical protein